MKNKLLNNLPIENLTTENDYLGVIEKGDLIKLFLEDNKAQFSEIKMFALYGEWGSGKSTLMKYLKKVLSPNFNTFFFDTWEFETDNNLSISLLEFLLDGTKDAIDEVSEDFMKVASKLLRGFSKSIRISFPGLSIDGKALTEELESEKEESFSELKKEFKFQFEQFEDKLKAQRKKEYNVIFIDDLDRCEPENVLNLLSALKLFFTYGKRTIFFCGIDKKAIKEAVSTKYGDVIKSNEYLEKIFDISFEMPDYEDVQKLVDQYFGEREIQLGTFKGKLNEKIGDFFNQLGFSNPRRIKKVLNKYGILARFKQIEKTNSTVPNIIISNNPEGNFLETILTLYFLILNEFFKDKLEAFYNIELKKINFRKAVENRSRNQDGRTIANNIDQVNKFLEDGNLEIELNSFSKVNLKNQQQRQESIKNFIKIFSPHNPDFLNDSAFINANYFSKHFQISHKKVDYYLAKYLMENIHELVLNDNSISDYKISNFRKMLAKYL